jgi:hypothetical protein
MARISEPVVGAKVRLAGAATAETSTAADGAFTLPELPPGQYKLTVDAGGGQASIYEPLRRSTSRVVPLLERSYSNNQHGNHRALI